MNITAKDRIGQQIRSFHPWAYKRGEWATIIGVTENCEHKNQQRGCFQLEWPDGSTDDWAIDDPVAEYEFRNTPITIQEGQ